MESRTYRRALCVLAVSEAAGEDREAPISRWLPCGAKWPPKRAAQLARPTGAGPPSPADAAAALLGGVRSSWSKAHGLSSCRTKHKAL